MNRHLHTPRAKLVIAVAAVAVLSGCASVNLEQNLTSANTAASGFTDGQLTLARDQSERDALRQRASDLLADPLSQNNAVQLALVNSPSMQAIVAQNWADASTAAQSATMAASISTVVDGFRSMGMDLPMRFAPHGGGARARCDRPSARRRRR